MILRNLACLLVVALAACSLAAQPQPPQKTEDQYRSTTDGKSGVEGDFWYQYYPGPAGAKIPPKEKRGGGIVKLY